MVECRGEVGRMPVSDWLRDPGMSRMLSRRRLLTVSGQVAALGFAASLLAACGGDDDDDEETTPTAAAGEPTPTGAAAEPTATGAAEPSATGGSGAGDATSTVPLVALTATPISTGETSEVVEGG